MSSSSSPGPTSPTSPPGATARCRGCGARLRPGDTWCSLCHRNVLDGPEPGPAELESHRPSVPEPALGAQARTDPALGAQARTGPAFGAEARTGPALAPAPRAAADDERSPTDPAVLAAADRLIAQLASAEAALNRESPLNALQGRLGTRGGGVTLAVVGGLVLLGIGLLGLTLLGLLL